LDFISIHEKNSEKKVEETEIFLVQKFEMVGFCFKHIQSYQPLFI